MSATFWHPLVCENRPWQAGLSRVAGVKRVLALFLFLGLAIGAAPAQSNTVPLAQQRWFETRTEHFNLYSCGAIQDVRKLAARLEQFCEAYTLLAGAQAVASPPIVVLAFPNQEAMTPFLPLYQGRPGNMAGFFKRSSEENLIVLALQGTNAAITEMEVIFHEYTHLLLRRNSQIWPLWLNEGMADVYSTFETSGQYVRIGKPIPLYLQLLAREPLLPLARLFAVTTESPQYNERERQGIFYAESWLLTHFLMAGDNPAFKARFSRFAKLLREGQLPVPAFTNALEMTLPAMETQLRRYLERGKFAPIPLVLPTDLSYVKGLTTRAITPVETCFHLGDELLRIDRLDAAEKYFAQAQKLAPASPLPCEGLGLLAAQRARHEEALRHLREALLRGSTNFLVHYVCAREQYRLTADSQNRYAPLDHQAAFELRGEIQKSLALMPNFGPAHELLGFFEMVQGEDLAAAEQHLQRAIQLEPENPSVPIFAGPSAIEKQASPGRAPNLATAAAAPGGSQTPRPRPRNDPGNGGPLSATFLHRLEFETQLWQAGLSRVAGVDEAGRGPLAGPVVAAAVILPRAWAVAGFDERLRDLNDSKQLTGRQREEFFALLTSHPEIRHAIASADAGLIDRVNILQATHRAMNQALAELQPPPEHVLVDGLRVKSMLFPQTPLVKGDARSYSIAAASVLAKVTRDRLMLEYDRQWPVYGFAEHKGYGTPRHLAALAQHGPCPIHRRSFAPIKPKEAELF